MSIPLVVLAAGLSTRYGRLKQLDPLGPGGEAIMDYNVYDAIGAGFERVVVVTREEIEEQVRDHFRDVVGDTIRVDYVRQSLEDLPEGFRAPPDRARPWGTGHAVLCASPFLDGPFAVCNADDLYGPGAFKKLHRHLTADPVTTGAALVGYPLTDTLSGHGGVARGVCVLKKDGLLSRVSEIRQIRRIDGWITGLTTDGEPLELSGNEIVSMNLWGFTQEVVDHMRRQFRRFLGTWGADWRQEFFLSTAINGQVQVGATEAAVLRADETWFGITHASDRDLAHASLRERIEMGDYPEKLRSGFAALV